MDEREEKIRGVSEYVQKHGRITNRECRKLLDLGYDESMRLLREMCEMGILTRLGSASNTHYVLSKTN